MSDPTYDRIRADVISDLGWAETPEIAAPYSLTQLQQLLAGDPTGMLRTIILSLWQSLKGYKGDKGDPGDPGPAGTTNPATSSALGGIKLAGDLSGTANSPSVPALVNKANKVHTHETSDINLFDTVVKSLIQNSIVAGVGITIGFNEETGKIVITNSGGGEPVAVDAEEVRDIIAAALVGNTNISVAYDDANDIITISTSATVNSTDAQLRDRSTHTGTQSADTIVDGTTNKAYTASEKVQLGNNTTKLAGIAANATKNATDAQLRDRSTHTGTQTASTISDLSDVISAATGAVVGGAPTVLNTLNKIAIAINNDPDFYNTLVALLATKVDSEDLALVATTGEMADLSGTGTIVQAAPNSVIAVKYDGSAWPANPTSRTDITFDYIGGTESTPPTNARVGDIWDYTP